jgi:hypothetical protein
MVNNKKSKTSKNKEAIKMREKTNVEDFMPNWKMEEECFKSAVLTDVDAKKKTGDTWPRRVR